MEPFHLKLDISQFYLVGKCATWIMYASAQMMSRSSYGPLCSCVSMLIVQFLQQQAITTKLRQKASSKNKQIFITK